MRTLRESLLNNTRDKLAGVHDTIRNVSTLGGMFHLENVRGLSTRSSSCISAKGVDNLTKGMDITDDRLARGSFGSNGKKIRNLINWLLHIDLIEWGYVDPDWNDRKVRQEFGRKVCETLNAAGAFNSNGECWISSESFSPFYKDCLAFMFTKSGKFSISDCFTVVLKLND
jgi:hypothetical protein